MLSFQEPCDPTGAGGQSQLVDSSGTCLDCLEDGRRPMEGRKLKGFVPVFNLMGSKGSEGGLKGFDFAGIFVLLVPKVPSRLRGSPNLFPSAS
jgi:hypothetical protein